MERFVFSAAPRAILGALMLAGVAINFANVVGRYAFGRPLFWAEELLVYLIVWGVFVGMVAVTYDGAHLNMDLFSSAIRGRWRRALNFAVAAVLIACCAVVIVQSVKVVALFIDARQVSVTAGIPKAIPHAALVVGFAFSALAVLVRIRSYIAGKF